MPRTGCDRQMRRARRLPRTPSPLWWTRVERPPAPRDRACPERGTGKDKSQNGIADPEVEGLRPQAIAFGKIAGEEGRDADGEISGKLVQAYRKPARLRTDEVDLHDDGHRPGKALVDAQKRIRRDHPLPARSPGDHERNRQPNEPAEDQHMFAAVDIGE